MDNYDISYHNGILKVQDTQAPIIACQAASIYLDETGNATLTPDQIDGGTADPSIFMLSVSQNSFVCSEVGDHNITLTATDIYTNTATCDAVVTVVDNIQPVVTAPANVPVVGNCDGVATIDIGTATATDNCGIASITGVRQGAQITDPYPVGTTIVTWTATDVNGNVSIPVDQTITVSGNISASITGNATVTVGTSQFNGNACSVLIPEAFLKPTVSSCGAYVLTRFRSDLPAQMISPYPLGNTTVTWQARNGATLLATFIQVVTVTDDEKPVMLTNGDKDVNTDPGVCGATVVVSATATDNCTVPAPTGVRSDNLALNDLYPVGTTTITWNVQDVNGNNANEVIQTVVVSDESKSNGSYTEHNRSAR